MVYPAKTERNEALTKDYYDFVVPGKWTIVDLVSKYRISSAAIYAILKLNKKHEN